MDAGPSLARRPGVTIEALRTMPFQPERSLLQRVLRASLISEVKRRQRSPGFREGMDLVPIGIFIRSRERLMERVLASATRPPRPPGGTWTIVRFDGRGERPATSPPTGYRRPGRRRAP